MVFSIFTDITILVLLVALSAFFSASETAIISVSRYRVRAMVQKDRAGAKYLQKLKDDPHRTITVVLICNTLVNITASVIAADIAITAFGSIGVGIAAAGMTFILLLFGEISPKMYAQTNADRLSLFVARPMYGIGIVLTPFVVLFDSTLPKLFRLKRGPSKITEEDLKTIIELSREEGTIDQEEHILLKNIFKFDDKTADSIRTPRMEMVCIAKGKTLKEFFDLAMAKQHSRIPVYEKSKDTIIGVVYLREVLPLIHAGQWSTPVESIMQKVLVIPPGKKIDELLRLMQRKQQHLAIVIDEFGGVRGLVTMEDILEEIVGEIMDETERVEPHIREEGKDWRVLGKMAITEFNRKLKGSIPEDDAYDTVGGFVMHQIGRIPKEGQVVKHYGFTFTVANLEGNRIKELMVTRQRK